jgi:hypothetical protein
VRPRSPSALSRQAITTKLDASYARAGYHHRLGFGSNPALLRGIYDMNAKYGDVVREAKAIDLARLPKSDGGT